MIIELYGPKSPLYGTYDSIEQTFHGSKADDHKDDGLSFKNVMFKAAMNLHDADISSLASILTVGANYFTELLDPSDSARNLVDSLSMLKWTTDIYGDEWDPLLKPETGQMTEFANVTLNVVAAAIAARYAPQLITSLTKFGLSTRSKLKTRAYRRHDTKLGEDTLDIVKKLATIPNVDDGILLKLLAKGIATDSFGVRKEIKVELEKQNI